MVDSNINLEVEVAFLPELESHRKKWGKLRVGEIP
ncbi:uncharacterized protein METZ01_LOCUS484579 [marine metagenome]|uniref:Uncharacterized protein n=1 Tax=marine metagenome TaxID=408172 RepID=A0A383CIZ9_9ZZZZ